MNTLIIVCIVFALLAALVVYAACVRSGQISRQEENR